MTRPYNNQQKKITGRIVEFTAPIDHRGKLNENEKKDKFGELASVLKNVEHENDDYTNCNWCSSYSQ